MGSFAARAPEVLMPLYSILALVGAVVLWVVILIEARRYPKAPDHWDV